MPERMTPMVRLLWLVTVLVALAFAVSWLAAWIF